MPDPQHADRRYKPDRTLPFEIKTLISQHSMNSAGRRLWTAPTHSLAELHRSIQWQYLNKKRWTVDGWWVSIHTQTPRVIHIDVLLPLIALVCNDLAGWKIWVRLCSSLTLQWNEGKLLTQRENPWQSYQNRKQLNYCKKNQTIYHVVLQLREYWKLAPQGEEEASLHTLAQHGGGTVWCTRSGANTAEK